MKAFGYEHLTAEIALRFLLWDPSTGKLYRKRIDRRQRSGKLGREAGTIFKSGNTRYRRISVAGCGRFMAHNLVWLIAYGHLPDELDHGDGDGLNNKLGNLADVGRPGNAKNRARYRSNTSGQSGVRWLNHVSRWQATIGVGGRNRSLGCFVSIGEAIRVRKRAERRFGYHANHGRSTTT